MHKIILQTTSSYKKTVTPIGASQATFSSFLFWKLLQVFIANNPLDVMTRKLFCIYCRNNLAHKLNVFIDASNELSPLYKPYTKRFACIWKKRIINEIFWFKNVPNYYFFNTNIKAFLRFASFTISVEMANSQYLKAEEYFIGETQQIMSQFWIIHCH